MRAHYHGQQQPTVQPEQQPQQQPQDPNDAIRAALENPHVRAALENEVIQVTQAAQAYQQSTLQAAQMAAAATFAFAPELANLSPQELPTAIRVIGIKDPARAQAIEQHIGRTQQLFAAHQQAAAHQQQFQAAQLKQAIDAEDQRFEQHLAATEAPETIRAVKDSALQVLTEDYGIPREALAQAWNTQPILRTKEFQQLAYDAIKYRTMQRQVANKVSRDVPPVQRPGVSNPQSRNAEAVETALKAFKSDPSVANAAKLLQARRSSR